MTRLEVCCDDSNSEFSAFAFGGSHYRRQEKHVVLTEALCVFCTMQVIISELSKIAQFFKKIAEIRLFHVVKYVRIFSNITHGCLLVRT